MNTIKINNIEVPVDELKKIIKENPELLEESKNESRYFIPKERHKYFYLSEYGTGETYYTDSDSDDIRRVLRGVYKTKEQAELADQRRIIQVKLWNYADENMPFTPDWSDGSQDKYYVVFEHSEKKLAGNYNSTHQSQTELPYFKSYEDRNQFIKDNKSDLEIWFNVK